MTVRPASCPDCGGPITKYRGNIEAPVCNRLGQLARLVYMGAWWSCAFCEWTEELR